MAHRAAVDTLQADAVHQIKAFIPHGPAIGIALMKRYFKWRITAEELIRALPAQCHAETVLVHFFSCKQRADGASDQIGLENSVTSTTCPIDEKTSSLSG